MVIYNITDQVNAAWEFYDKLLDERLAEIQKLTGIDRSQLIKINPAEFIVKNKYQKIDNYTYRNVRDFIKEKKNDDTYLISPCDAVIETANQIAYKENEIEQVIRASKCECVPIPQKVALSFFIKNHRQRLPHLRVISLSYGLVYKDRLVAVMTYDKGDGAVRGNLKCYELLRLAIAHGCRIQGGGVKIAETMRENTPGNG